MVGNRMKCEMCGESAYTNWLLPNDRLVHRHTLIEGGRYINGEFWIESVEPSPAEAGTGQSASDPQTTTGVTKNEPHGSE